MGALYRRTFTNGTIGDTWWLKYYVAGRPVRERTGTTDEAEAKRILKTKEGWGASGEPVLPRVDRIKYDEIAAELRGHYEASGERNLEEADDRVAHLKRFFAGSKVASLGPNDFTQYALTRQKQGAANGTINRDLGVLGRMLRLAYENGKLHRPPIIRQLKEADPRSVFFERDQYGAVRRRLPDDLKVAVTSAYKLGWRIKSEVLTLTLTQVDLAAGTIRLEPGQTKNDDGRLVYLTPELTDMLREKIERVKILMRKRGAVIPYLVPHLSGRYVGHPIRNFVRK